MSFSHLSPEQAERAGDYGRVAELRYGKIQEAEQRLKALQQAVEQNQDANPMLKEEVTSEDIAEVVAKWTGIPVSKMLQSDREKLLHLEAELGNRVAGQEEAIAAISDAVRRSRAGGWAGHCAKTPARWSRRAAIPPASTQPCAG